MRTDRRADGQTGRRAGCRRISGEAPLRRPSECNPCRPKPENMFRPQPANAFRQHPPPHTARLERHQATHLAGSEDLAIGTSPGIPFRQRGFRGTVAKNRTGRPRRNTADAIRRNRPAGDQERGAASRKILKRASSVLRRSSRANSNSSSSRAAHTSGR